MSKKAKKILEQLEDTPELGVPMLSIVVDFNQLHGEWGNDAFEIVGKLKDLLR